MEEEKGLMVHEIVNEISEISDYMCAIKKSYCLLTPMFEEFRESKDPIPEETVRALISLEESLESTKELLRFGSERSKIFLVRNLLTSEGILSIGEDLSLIFDISAAIFANLEVLEISLEKVGHPAYGKFYRGADFPLLGFRRAKGRVGSLDIELYDDLLSIYNKSSDADTVLSGGDPGESIEKMEMLLKKIKDSVQTENLNISAPAGKKCLPSSGSGLASTNGNSKSPVIPDDFCCPLSLKLMRDPVIISSGQDVNRCCTRGTNGEVLDRLMSCTSLELKQLTIEYCRRDQRSSPQSSLTMASNNTPLPPPPSSSPTPSPTLQAAPIHHLIKLDRQNFLLWRTQFLPILIGYDLEGYVDGTITAPPRTLSDGSTNPAYTSWRKQDQVLLGWLLSSISETVLPQVVGLASSRAVWVMLENQFASRSRARIMQIRRELQTMRKGNLTMVDYFQKAKQLADNLAASGNTMPDCDLQQCLINGLDSAYDAIVTTLTATLENTSMDDFQAHLLAYDMRLEAQQSALATVPVVNMAAQNLSMTQSTFNYRNNTYRGSNNRNCGNPRARQRPSPSNANHGQQIGPCQLCGRKNHTAKTFCAIWPGVQPHGRVVISYIWRALQFGSYGTLVSHAVITGFKL
ncbi:hypothetical protein HHK36_010980 [Tetracentron sinense]|uniref:U-box domain-containing protein n=1 Tax=Tetracentron sinense TaxID=13715 RepID=A0A835DFU3_TETSI|nr:hypothetical protein HHK36_010980 [Tetracentron sinense]